MLARPNEEVRKSLDAVIRQVENVERKRLYTMEIFARIYDAGLARDEAAMQQIYKDYAHLIAASDDEVNDAEENPVSDDESIEDDEDEEKEERTPPRESEDISNNKSHSFIDIFDENNLTPAGKLAKEGHKTAAEFLRRHHSAHIDYIARGAAQHLVLYASADGEKYQWSSSSTYVERLRKDGALLAECVYGAGLAFHYGYLRYVRRVYDKDKYSVYDDPKPIPHIPVDALAAGLEASGRFKNFFSAVEALKEDSSLELYFRNAFEKLSQSTGLNYKKISQQAHNIKELQKGRKSYIQTEVITPPIADKELAFAWSFREVQIWILQGINLVRSNRMTFVIFLKVASFFTNFEIEAKYKELIARHEAIQLERNRASLQTLVNAGLFKSNYLQPTGTPDAQPKAESSHKRRFLTVETRDKRVMLFRRSEETPQEDKQLNRSDLFDQLAKISEERQKRAMK